jgi:hypothetical protein
VSGTNSISKSSTYGSYPRRKLFEIAKSSSPKSSRVGVVSRSESYAPRASFGNSRSVNVR